jgi:hypothetical protein
MRQKLLVLLILLPLSSALIAHADTLYSFSASGTDSFSFSLPASPTNGVVDPAPGHFGFFIDSIPVTFNNALYDVKAEFYTTANFGGVDLFYAGTSTYFAGISLSGPQLFTGSLDSPTFLLGTFNLTNFFTGGSTTVTVSQVPAPIPEPSAWLLLGTGIVGLVSFTRTTKRV